MSTTVFGQLRKFHSIIERRHYYTVEASCARLYEVIALMIGRAAQEQLCHLGSATLSGHWRAAAPVHGKLLAL